MHDRWHYESVMSLLKITPRALLRTAIRVDGIPRRVRHRLSPSIERSRHPVISLAGCLVYYSADQYHTRPLQSGVIHTPHHYSVYKLSSSRKPLSFTDDLLQKHIKQLIDEWNQMQRHLTGDQSDSDRLSAQETSKRLHFLDPVMSRIKQHEQYSADISELADIISGMFIYCLVELTVN